MQTQERTYPIRPRPDEDERFTFGLLADIEKVLEQHGYPPLSGADHAELNQALYRFLYMGS